MHFQYQYIQLSMFLLFPIANFDHQYGLRRYIPKQYFSSAYCNQTNSIVQTNYVIIIIIVASCDPSTIIVSAAVPVPGPPPSDYFVCWVPPVAFESAGTT